jgi:PAS domain S-box-containing protein
LTTTTTTPGDGADADVLLTRWRQRATTVLLWVMGALGAPLVLVFVGPLLEARSYGTLAFSVFLVVADLFLAARRRVSLSFRASWAVFNVAAAGVPELFLGGDRGASAALILAAMVLAVLLVGARLAVVIGVVYTLLIAATAWGYATGTLPLGVLAPVDWNTPQGWLGLWAVVNFCAALVVVAAAMMFRQLRVSFAEQQAAAAAREGALAEVVREREAALTQRERADAAEAARLTVERTLAEALSVVGAGVFEADLVRDTATWSEGMYTLLGYAPGGVTPSMAAWTAHIHPDDVARVLATPPQATPSFEYRVVLPDGGQRTLRTQMDTVLDEGGRPVRVRGIVTDVTAEKQTAKQLARLAEVASRTENAVVVTDLQGLIEWVNDAFVRLTGWQLDEVVGKPPSAFLQGPHTAPSVRAEMRAAIAARQPFQVEVLNYARDGRQYWVQIETRLALDEHGQPSGFIAIETDVTERRIADSRDALARRVAAVLLSADNIVDAANAVLRELVAELDIVVAQLWLVQPGNPQLVWLAGASAPSSGEAGRAFLEITRGLSFQAGTDRHVGVGVPGVAWGTRRSVALQNFSRAGSDGQQSRRLEAAVAAGVHTFSATPILGADGVLGVVEIGGTAYYPGHERLPALLERVTEQLASFLRHDVSRRAFETIFASSPDALLLIDDAGVVLDENARARALFGDVVDRRIGALIEEVDDVVRAALSGNAAPATLFQRAARGAAGAFSAEITASVAPSSTKQVAILAVRDLTERHRIEAALQRSLREKDTLLREVHHRVKNNLQIVSSLLTLQADGMERGVAREALDETVLRVRSMSYVHQQLYGTEGVDAVDVGAYARTLATALSGSLDPRARLHFSLASIEVAVDVAVPCALILNELITNALKHGRRDDGSCDVHVDVARDEGHLVVSVRDEGKGMPPTALSSATLGMQLVRSLARQLRGKVVVDNAPGARVALRVPLAEPTAATVRATT